MRRPRLLIVKTGSAAAEITCAHGDYERWFMAALGEPERFHVEPVFEGQPAPDARAFDGVIVTGSPLSACVPAPWMQETALRLREWAEAGVPLLGVCFGHQLLSLAFDAPVVKNPRGREIGTIEVTLTAAGQADPLFAGLGPSVRVQATHSDVASRLGAGATLLASNENAPVQAAAFGPRARGVQFHPELVPAAMRALIRSRREAMRAEGLDPEACERAVDETPAGERILRNWEERLVGGR